jgi:hemolysin-activating ACP:hemolysin acyltransferase
MIDAQCQVQDLTRCTPGFYEAMGLAASLMSKRSEYCEYPIACIPVWIEPAIRLQQIHFFYDLGKVPIGYMTWALLAVDTEDRLLHDPNVLFHFSEWNEGDRLWIMDLVLIGGDLRQVVREAFSLFPKFVVAKSVRRAGDGGIRRISTWRRRPGT